MISNQLIKVRRRTYALSFLWLPGIESRRLAIGRRRRLYPRRRECLQCGTRFTTYERLAENPILVIKADGSSEVFNREKLMRGLLIACAKRPITPEKIDGLITSIEAELRSSQRNEIKSRDLGDLVLARLPLWMTLPIFASPASTRISRMWRSSPRP